VVCISTSSWRPRSAAPFCLSPVSPRGGRRAGSCPSGLCCPSIKSAILIGLSRPAAHRGQLKGGRSLAPLASRAAVAYNDCRSSVGDLRRRRQGAGGPRDSGYRSEGVLGPSGASCSCGPHTGQVITTSLGCSISRAHSPRRALLAGPAPGVVARPCNDRGGDSCDCLTSGRALRGSASAALPWRRWYS